MLIEPSTDFSNSPQLDTDFSDGFNYVFIPPQPIIYQDSLMSDEVIAYIADTEGNPVSYLSLSIGNDALTGVSDMPVAEEAVAILHTANGTAGSGGLDAYYGDGYSEALTQYYLTGQLSSSDPHYNTIMTQEWSAQVEEIQNQQIYTGVTEIWNNSPVSGLENIVLDSSSGSIENFNANFVDNLESIFLG